MTVAQCGACQLRDNCQRLCTGLGWRGSQNKSVNLAIAILTFVFSFDELGRLCSSTIHHIFNAGCCAVDYLLLRYWYSSLLFVVIITIQQRLSPQTMSSQMMLHVPMTPRHRSRSSSLKKSQEQSQRRSSFATKRSHWMASSRI